jgi:hypothetical protein
LQDVNIFGYSRKAITDEDLRSMIEANLTCRVDHQYVSLMEGVRAWLHNSLLKNIISAIFI